MSQDIRELERNRSFVRRYWLDLVDRKFQPYSVRIDGEHYMIAREDATGAFRGHSGRKFTIRFDDGRTVTTTNLWSQGTIPEEFKSDLPDNARFL